MTENTVNMRVTFDEAAMLYRVLECMIKDDRESAERWDHRGDSWMAEMRRADVRFAEQMLSKVRRAKDAAWAQEKASR